MVRQETEAVVVIEEVEEEAEIETEVTGGRETEAETDPGAEAAEEEEVIEEMKGGAVHHTGA